MIDLKESLCITINNIYFDVHAIYEPSGGEIFCGRYCAAVDLFVHGMTFRIYFKINEK